MASAKTFSQSYKRICRGCSALCACPILLTVSSKTLSVTRPRFVFRAMQWAMLNSLPLSGVRRCSRTHMRQSGKLFPLWCHTRNPLTIYRKIVNQPEFSQVGATEPLKYVDTRFGTKVIMGRRLLTTKTFTGTFLCTWRWRHIWSIEGWIHNKRGNRLAQQNVERAGRLFCYPNSRKSYGTNTDWVSSRVLINTQRGMSWNCQHV